MTITLAGPSNNLYGPGLAFDVTTSLTVQANSELAVASFSLTGNPATEIAHTSTLLSASTRRATLIIGRSLQTLPGAYRHGSSVSNTVQLTILHTNVSGVDLEPPLNVGNVGWDPALQLESLIRFYAGGGSTDPNVLAKLDQIISYTSTTFPPVPSVG